MTEFTAQDHEVTVIADVFERMTWQWSPSGEAPFVPTSENIADTLNRLYDNSFMFLESHLDDCDTCKAGDKEYCADRVHEGSSSSGRLFVTWDDSDGYGPAVTFGIYWDREPLAFAGVES